MLVLTRKVGEKILIGSNIEVVVVEIDPRGRVRIGISAPKEVPIFRAELLDGQPPRKEPT